MKSNRKYIIILAATIIIFVVIQLLTPKAIDWTPTYSARDKNPFGSYVLNNQLKELFPNQKVNNNNLTFYEFSDSLSLPVNFIAMAERLDLQGEDMKSLLKHVNEGSFALLAAERFVGQLPDTLSLRQSTIIEKKPDALISDSSFVRLVNAEKEKTFPFRLLDIISGFERLDSIPAKVFIVARNQFDQPTLIRVSWGKGELLLSSTPRAFTNNYILYHNDDYVERALSHLPDRPMWWTEYYQLGRRESSSSLRVILRDPSLSWAYYLILIGLLLYVAFEGKRKQRIIPVIRPLANATLEFVRTVGNMYIQAGNHKSIAEKKITYFFEQMRTQYFLPSEHATHYAEVLAKKTGNSISETQALLALMRVIQNSPSISVDMLMDLNKKLEAFQKTENTTHNHKL